MSEALQLSGLPQAADFPLLRHHPRLVYLDSAATTPTCAASISAMRQWYEQEHSNVHRGIYALSEAATVRYEAARATVAGFLGVESVVFTAGCTAALNLVAAGWARPRLTPGDRVLVSPLEHHANLVPWQVACRQTGASLELLPMAPRTGIDLEAALAALPGAALLAITARSHVLGIRPPLEVLLAEARRCGVVTVLDAAQAAAWEPLAGLPFDFIAVSAHKLHGPTGVGALGASAARMAQVEPVVFGGGMVAEVTDTAATWRQAPWCLEAGTPPIAQAIGMAEAVDFLTAHDAAAVCRYRAQRSQRLHDALSQRPEVRLAPVDPRGGILSLSIPGVHPHDVADTFDEHDIAVRAGHHCARPLMARLGVVGLVRISLGPTGSDREVERVLSALDSVKERWL